MNKKISALIAFVILIIGMNFVLAELRWADGRYGVSDVTGNSIPLINGWNLIQGFADPSFIIGGTQGTVNSQAYIKAIFAFDPINKEYYQVYPNPEKSKLDKLGPAILQLPFWVYSSKGGESVSYQTEKLETMEVTWPKGWNLISISSEMVGKSLNEIKGSCNIEKAYFWTDKSDSNGGWVDILNSPEKFSRDIVGLGIAVKFTSECKLGMNGGSITPPPTLPTN